MTETYFLPVLEPEVQTQIQTRSCSLQGSGGSSSASFSFWWLLVSLAVPAAPPPHFCLHLHRAFSAYLSPFSLVRMLVIDLRPTVIQNDLIPRSLTQLNLKRLFPNKTTSIGSKGTSLLGATIQPITHGNSHMSKRSINHSQGLPWWSSH